MANNASQFREQPVSRRGFLAWVMGFSIIATLAGVLTPIIGYLWPSRRTIQAAPERTPVGNIADFPVSSGVVVPVADKPVIITHPAGKDLQAFSAICTHLGCVVHWEAAGGYIQCPCHDGRFNAFNGNVISGPPPRPLPRYELSVEDDSVYVGRPLDALYEVG